MFNKLRRNFKIKSNGSPGIGPILLLGTLFFLSTACALNESDRRIKLETLKLAPLSEMPDFVQSAASEVQEAYRFAKANPDLLKQIPCYCGCNSLGHMNNYDCYVAALQADGQETEYESHAAYWGICIDITRDVMQLTRAGKPVAEIRAFVDNKYSQYGPPTETRPVPGSQVSMAGPSPSNSTEPLPVGMAQEGTTGSCGQAVSSCQETGN